MPNALLSLIAGALLAALLVFATFVAVVGQALGKQNRPVQAIANFILGPGLKAGDGNPTVTIGVSWLVWAIALTATFFVVLSLTR